MQRRGAVFFEMLTSGARPLLRELFAEDVGALPRPERLVGRQARPFLDGKSGRRSDA